MKIAPEDRKKLETLIGLLQWFEKVTVTSHEIMEKPEREVRDSLWVLNADEKDCLAMVISAVEDCK
jgi:hypothetical protein